jgi:hypothetical protein
MLRHVINLSAGTKEMIQDAASKAIDSKAVAAAVAGSTAALGLSDIQSYAQLAATAAAFVLSVMLTVKHGLDIYREWKKSKAEDEKNQDNS